jgi:hypothetical protein
MALMLWLDGMMMMMMMRGGLACAQDTYLQSLSHMMLYTAPKIL